MSLLIVICPIKRWLSGVVVSTVAKQEFSPPACAPSSLGQTSGPSASLHRTISMQNGLKEITFSVIRYWL